MITDRRLDELLRKCAMGVGLWDHRQGNGKQSWNVGLGRNTTMKYASSRAEELEGTRGFMIRTVANGPRQVFVFGDKRLPSSRAPLPHFRLKIT